MSKYMTRQRKALLGCLCAHPDEQLSAQAIADALAGEEISLSAVYRNLSELEAEGKVRRSGRAGSREVYYQYIDADGCRGCLHLSCRECGRTFHLDPVCARRLVSEVQEAQGFAVDRSETVLYGVCERCRK